MNFEKLSGWKTTQLLKWGSSKQLSSSGCSARGLGSGQGSTAGRRLAKNLRGNKKKFGPKRNGFNWKKHRRNQVFEKEFFFNHLLDEQFWSTLRSFNHLLDEFLVKILMVTFGCLEVPPVKLVVSRWLLRQRTLWPLPPTRRGWGGAVGHLGKGTVADLGLLKRDTWIWFNFEMILDN